MKGNDRKILRNDVAFTGLEAAIVLIAFVVVAAVFSYVMLGAGFFTTQKSQEAVHNSVDQASKSLVNSGYAIAAGDAADTPTYINDLYVYLKLSAGGTSIDMTTVTASYQDANQVNPRLWNGLTGTMTWVQSAENTPNNMLDPGEMVKIDIPMGTLTTHVGTNVPFTVNIKAPDGAALTLSYTSPAVIEKMMDLEAS